MKEKNVNSNKETHFVRQCVGEPPLQVYHTVGRSQSQRSNMLVVPEPTAKNEICPQNDTMGTFGQSSHN